MHLTKENIYLYSTLIISALALSVDYFIVKQFINLITII